jgi:hypothetical protein
VDKEVAIRAAMVSSMANLSLDEQYVVGRMLCDLRERREEIMQSPWFLGTKLALSVAAFARRCLIAPDQAYSRLKVAVDAIFGRSIEARYPTGTRRDQAEHHFRWFDSKNMSADEITLRLSGDVARRLMMAIEVAPAPAEESASMIEQLFAASEVVAAVVVRHVSAADSAGNSDNP